MRRVAVPRVAQRRLPAAGSLPMACGAAPTLVAPSRTYEYWGLWVSPRTQPYCLGDKLPGLLNLNGAGQPSVEAQFLTGQLWNVPYEEKMLYDADAELSKLGPNRRFFNGHDKYILHPVKLEDCEAVGALFTSLGLTKQTMWEALFDLYPALRKPLDEPTREKFNKFYDAAIAIAHDETSTHALAKPFMLEMQETKYISAPYWWRISEAMMDTLEKQPTATRFSRRAVRLVVERMTKIMMNTLGDHPWSHDESTNAYVTDLCGHRATTEAGFW